MVPGGLWGVPGRPRGFLGEGPGGTENTDGFLRVSGGGPGGSLGCFWSFGVVLGTDQAGANVDILLVLMMFLRSDVFSFVFVCFVSFFFRLMKENK